MGVYGARKRFPQDRPVPAPGLQPAGSALPWRSSFARATGQGEPLSPIRIKSGVSCPRICGGSGRSGLTVRSWCEPCLDPDRGAGFAPLTLLKRMSAREGSQGTAPFRRRGGCRAWERKRVSKNAWRSIFWLASSLYCRYHGSQIRKTDGRNEAKSGVFP